MPTDVANIPAGRREPIVALLVSCFGPDTEVEPLAVRLDGEPQRRAGEVDPGEHTATVHDLVLTLPGRQSRRRNTSLHEPLEPRVGHLAGTLGEQPRDDPGARLTWASEPIAVCASHCRLKPRRSKSSIARNVISGPTWSAMSQIVLANPMHAMPSIVCRSWGATEPTWTTSPGNGGGRRPRAPINSIGGSAANPSTRYSQAAAEYAARNPPPQACVATHSRWCTVAGAAEKTSTPGIGSRTSPSATNRRTWRDVNPSWEAC